MAVNVYDGLGTSTFYYCLGCKRITSNKNLFQRKVRVEKENNSFYVYGLCKKCYARNEIRIKETV